jgi:hypothetical protein
MTHQPDDQPGIDPEQAKDTLSGRTEDWLSGNVEELNQRPADGPAGPLSEQPSGEGTEISAEPQPPSGA